MTEPQLWWAPWAIPVATDPVRDVLVTMRDGVIDRIESGVSREDAAAQGAECFDECVLAPGFVNAHSHIEYAAYDGLVDGLDFASWIADHIQRKSRLGREHMLASAHLGAQEALASGITCIGDASFSGDAATALVEAGLRGRVYLEVFGGSDEEQRLAECLERIGGLASSPLVSHGISPHAPYTVSERLYRLVAETGMPWMSHFNESADEVRSVLAGTGGLAEAMTQRGWPLIQWERSPLETIADLLSPAVTCVHLVHVSPSEREVLADSGAGAAHCPRSNARLGCGAFDLDAAERAGIQVGLGTDSPASAGPIDMFAELRTALEVHRSHAADAARPTTAQLLELATAGAAKALGYDDGLGTLTPGAPADIVACRVPQTTNPVTTYVLSGSPAAMRAVAIAGKVVWRHDRNQLEAARERAADARALLALPVRQPVA